VLSSTGLAGTIPLLAGLGLCCAGAWRARRGSHGILPLALLLVVLAANMSGNWIASKLLWLVLAYGLASMRYRGKDASGLPPPAAVLASRPTPGPPDRAFRGKLCTSRAKSGVGASHASHARALGRHICADA